MQDMSITNTITERLKAVQQAGRQLALLDVAAINQLLIDLAAVTESRIEELLEANAKDLALMDSSDPKYDRLKLTADRIKNITADLRNVAALDYPVGKVLEQKTLPNGLHLKKITVPMGVVGIIYESRPNVTFDVFSLCFKSGNACVLKGSRDAENSNVAIVAIIHEVLRRHQLPKDIVYLLPSERKATEVLLHATAWVDVIIPRGGQELINSVREHAKVPVIETGAGIVHTYFDVSADLHKGIDIVDNAKTRRVSVCNALDCLIVHQSRLHDLPQLTKALSNKGVQIFADEPSFAALQSAYPAALLYRADEASYGTEFLSLKMAVKTVDGLAEALEHVARYSSKHSEAIIAEDADTIERFLRSVDAAAVYANASTAFTDGAQFGLGAEIGISTQKLHARGPMGLSELTSYKWIIQGNGQVRQA